MKKVKRYHVFNASQNDKLRKALEGVTLYKTNDRVGDETDESLGETTVSPIKGNVLSQNTSRTVDPKAFEDEPSSEQTVAGLRCSSCNCLFETVQEQRLHWTLDWHRYNLKRKSSGLASVNEEQFGELLDGLSSISGSEDDEPSSASDTNLVKLVHKTAKLAVAEEKSDSEDESKEIKKLWSTPKIFLETSTNELLAAYKCIFPFYSKNETFRCGDATKYLGDLALRKPMWAIIMLSGGHFAAGIFKGEEEVVHKTFHSYTVRAKQGGSQSSRDSRSGTSHPKSAGASLRRYNEQAFNQHVQDLLRTWKDKLQQCEVILYRAVSGNLPILFGSEKDRILNKKSKYVHHIPFPTKRPTFKEVKRVLMTVSTIVVLDRQQMIKRSKSPTKPGCSRDVPKVDSSKQLKTDANAPQSASDESDIEPLEERADQFTNLVDELQELDDESRRKRRKKNKPQQPEKIFAPPSDLLPILDALSAGNEDNILIALSELSENALQSLNEKVTENGMTILHLATQNEMHGVIWRLLELGATPSVKDKDKKWPYNLAKSKECRKVFMRFQADYPDKYDYRKAQIPGPLTKEMEEQKAEKEKLLKEQKREKEKRKKAEKRAKQIEEEEQQRYLNLSDREKRALAAEKRLLAGAKKSGTQQPVLVRCFECGIDISGKVPFEYCQNIFCTPKCLSLHRDKNSTL